MKDSPLTRLAIDLERLICEESARADNFTPTAWSKLTHAFLKDHVDRMAEAFVNVYRLRMKAEDRPEVERVKAWA